MKFIGTMEEKLESDLLSLERRFELRDEELREVLERVRQLELLLTPDEVAGVLEDVVEREREDRSPDEQRGRGERPQTSDAILEERERAWTQDYQPRIKHLEDWKVRLEEENDELYSENVLLKGENEELLLEIERMHENRDQELACSTPWGDAAVENLRAAYERLQKAHTAVQTEEKSCINNGPTPVDWARANRVDGPRTEETDQ